MGGEFIVVFFLSFFFFFLIISLFLLFYNISTDRLVKGIRFLYVDIHFFPSP